MRKMILAMLVMFGGMLAMQAQEQTGEKKLVTPAYDEFNPHWFMQVQGGASYHVGEADFKDLISPAAQVAIGYKFSKLVGVRLAVSGWEAKNQYKYPHLDYKWNFVQPNVDFMFDLSTLFAGWKPERRFNSYLFVGGGMPIGFNNDDAVNAQKSSQATQFRKLWDGTKCFWAARAGLGADVRIAKHVAIGLEVNANMISDKFNSKKGKHDNVDWQINGLLGLKFTFGKTHKHHDAVYEYTQPQPQPQVQPAQIVEPKPEPEPQPVEKKAEVKTTNVFFAIGKSEIRPSETAKLDDLVSFLKDNPDSKVTLTGYADNQTGTKAVNERISKQRAEEVKKYLVDKGIESGRITTDYKGDTVQPFGSVEENRVTMAVTK